MLPRRGGNWNNGVAAGVFALHLNNTRANSNHNIGFRAALLSKPDAVDSRVCFQCGEDKGACFHAERQKTRLSWKPIVAKANSATHDKYKKITGNGLLPFRGGSFNNGVAAGVFALNLNNPRANASTNIGFRAALLSKPDAVDLRVCFQCREDKGVRFHAERQKT